MEAKSKVSTGHSNLLLVFVSCLVSGLNGAGQALRAGTTEVSCQDNSVFTEPPSLFQGKQTHPRHRYTV